MIATLPQNCKQSSIQRFLSSLNKMILLIIIRFLDLKKQEMDNFEIEEGTTNEELTEQVRKSSQIEPEVRVENSLQNQQKVEDQFDLFNCGLTAGFKIIAITLYLILKLLTDSYLATFVVTVILISIDFWVTKNLTGRKLVGLRWWSQITESGQQQWVFQSRSPNRSPHSANVSIFWIFQLIAVVFWFLIFLINIFTFSLFWIGLALFCAFLSILNFICFFKCRGEHQNKAKKWGKKLGMKNVSQVF